MRAQLQIWIEQTGDMGGAPEDELIERMWPGRKQPVTAVPNVKIETRGKYKFAIIQCPNEGASIGYRLGTKGSWQLYSKPIGLKGFDVLQTKAIRIGYKESPIATRHVEQDSRLP